MKTGEKGGGGAAPARRSGESLLLCGGSGSGKTSYLLAWCGGLKSKKHYVVGGDPEDFGVLDPPPETVKLSDAKQLLPGSAVLIDDLFSLARTDHEALRYLLCYAKRHRGIHVGVATHTLHYTGMQGLLRLFDSVVFTRTPSGEKDHKIFLDAVKIPNLELGDFRLIRGFGYLKADLRSQTFAHGEDTRLTKKKAAASAPSAPDEDLLRGIRDMLKVFPEGYERMNCHLSHVMKNIDPLLVASNDYTLQLSVSKGSGTPVLRTVSLVDYLICCQEEEAGKRVHPSLLLLHKYFSSRFNTPRYLIKNPTMDEGRR